MDDGQVTVDVAPEKITEDAQSKKFVSAWRILTLGKPEWPWLVVGLLMLVLSLVPSAIYPFIFGNVLDTLVADMPNHQKKEEIGTQMKIFMMIYLKR